MAVFDGFVEKKSFTLAAYTTLSGKTIRHLKVGWESYGRLNQAADNVILVPHYYSANSHVAGRYRDSDPAPGYWDSIIGPGKVLDTDRFFVISVDSLVNLNSKDGITITTGPASIDPDTGKPYGLRFPVVAIPDFVRVQKALLDSLGIKRLYACAGVSMGALQAYEWAAAYPDMVERVIAVNGTPTQRPFALCNLEKWVASIKLDPHWNCGDYYGKPEPTHGLAHAFCNVIIDAMHPQTIAAAYRHQWADPEKSPLEALENDYAVNQSIKAMALARAATTDANTMLYMTRANQLFVAGTTGSSVDADLKNIRAKTLVIQCRSDLLFPAEDARAQVAILKKNGTPAAYAEIDSDGGHLAGITEIAKASDAIQHFMDQ